MLLYVNAILEGKNISIVLRDWKSNISFSGMKNSHKSNVILHCCDGHTLDKTSTAATYGNSNLNHCQVCHQTLASYQCWVCNQNNIIYKLCNPCLFCNRCSTATSIWSQIVVNKVNISVAVTIFSDIENDIKTINQVKCNLSIKFKSNTM